MFLPLFTALAVLAPTMSPATDPGPGRTPASSFAGPQVRATMLEPGPPPLLGLRLQNPTRNTTFNGIYLRATCTGADGAQRLTLLLSAPGTAEGNRARLPSPPDYTMTLAAPMAPRSTLNISVPLDRHPTLTDCTKTHLRGAW
ncbi:hypothetical protein KUV51_21120 [Tateyamaria omphalii]|uniref:hypothetical protein n=1 Tax=Tateyamaria omphalii TaxID=299262 RepID=UPI001C99463B|nr:hypothetical protein [Tateyamaria omphalii]MBY5935523.1 hypothetical protein [Tateyamaria omphalii]